ncbi:DUF6069 family protein [Leekyejoonella antrihumi]|uniref:Uncharacterized protein n=1 Tax=Leekyejoonella antrihumi TaxID=1660198 RepID=A0A563DUL1_9MICO|nr:DUF6069 family protein [Leekyejoonella antrihumi]TWP33947.1 hypothetical protein FGL98_19120 [Leekyejoonella antrihumi]
MSTTAMNSTLGRLRTRVMGRAAVVVAAVVCAVTGWAVLHLLLRVDLLVKTGSSPASVGWVGVVLTAQLAACAGWASMGLIERRRCHSRRPWTALALAVLTVSLLGPLEAASVAAGVGLLCLHLVVGLTIILGLRRTAC